MPPRDPVSTKVQFSNAAKKHGQNASLGMTDTDTHKTKFEHIYFFTKIFQII